MTSVFEFLTFDLTRQQGQRWVKTLEGLDAGHFICAHHMRACRGERWSHLVHLTDRADLLGHSGGIVSGWGEPIPFAVRL